MIGVSSVPTVVTALSVWATEQATSQTLQPIHLLGSATTKAFNLLFTSSDSLRFSLKPQYLLFKYSPRQIVRSAGEI
jgi:hypothetical protein